MKTGMELQEALIVALDQACEVFFLTDPTATILYVNPAFEVLTGYSSAEAVGKKASLLKSGEHNQAFYRDLWTTIRSGKPWRGRLVNRRKDGSLYLDEQRICPITDASGKIQYYFSTRRDVTREIQLESQLNQSQKMESLGLLAGQISHDFNNLLTVIIGSMELIMEDLKEGSVGHKLSSEILRSSKESAALIKNLMIFARKHESRPVVTTLNEPVDEIKPLLSGLLGKGVTLAYDLDPVPSKVKIEPEHFKQAIMNLAVNAKDAMSDNGAIKIKTFTAGPDGVPHSLLGEKYAAFEISDTGPGIPKDVLPRIFEPFFTTKPKGKGTGLGLSSVYGIIHQNNGHIFADNKPGGGAVFTVYFPVMD